MLAYRHAFHAGNHADVLKHVVLAEVLRYMGSKDKAFSYIVESRWRAEKPDQGDLADLGAKVGGKLTSTRGCFVSIAGFRPEALASFQRSQPNNIIYVDGGFNTVGMAFADSE